jgi:tetratricopeptide (TPR) repeat protein
MDGSTANESKRAGTWLLGVLILALAVRVVYLVIYYHSPFWDQLTVDNWYHLNWARSIADGNILGDTTYFRAPFYIFCLAGLKALLGDSLWWPRLFGLAIGLGSIAMTYLLGARLFGRRAGLIAALLQSLLPAVMYYESEILLDPLFTLLLQITVLRAVIWMQDGSSGSTFWLGVICGLAAITRPTVLVAIPVFLAFAVVLFGWRNIARHGMFLALGLCVFIAPVTARNLIVAHDPVLIASQSGVNLYIGNNEAADGFSAAMPEPMGNNWQIRQITHLAQQETGQSLRPGQVSDYWTKKALSWAAANPGRFIRLFLTKAYYQFLSREVSNDRALDPFFQQIPILKYNPLAFGMILPLAVLGILSCRPVNRNTAFLLALAGVYIVAVSMFFYNSRFRLPLLPIWLLFAGCGVSSTLDSLASSTKRRLALTALLIAATAAFSFCPLVSLPRGILTGHVTSRGLYLYAKDDIPGALDQFREAAHLDPLAPEVNLNVGVCLFRTGQADSARFYFERELQLHPGRAKVYQNLASMAVVGGRWSEARNWSDKALQIAPYDVATNQIFLRALALDSAIGTDSLVRSAYRAVHATENDLQVIDEAASLLAHRGRPDAAELLLRAGLVAPLPPIETDDLVFGPNFPHGKEAVRRERAHIQHQLGYLAGLGGRYDEAVSLCRQAIAGDPQLADAYLNLAMAHLSLGQRPVADSVLAEAVRRFPDYQRVQELLRELSR